MEYIMDWELGNLNNYIHNSLIIEEAVQQTYFSFLCAEDF